MAPRPVRETEPHTVAHVELYWATAALRPGDLGEVNFVRDESVDFRTSCDAVLPQQVVSRIPAVNHMACDRPMVAATSIALATVVQHIPFKLMLWILHKLEHLRYCSFK